MTGALDAFRVDYAAALGRYLDSGSESDLTFGHDLGRRALVEGISILDITENHYRVSADALDTRAALQFLLQTLTALDVATRGFLSGAQRYAQQRARADDLAQRDAFRRALVDALQEGFFVADGRGRVIEVNTAFGELTGYGADGVPYSWPHPWVAPDNPLHKLADVEVIERWTSRGGRFIMPIRHRDGRQVWVAVTANPVAAQIDSTETIFVGTIRDITGERIAAAREQVAARLATALSAATTVADVFTAGLGEACAAIDAAAAVAVIWAPGNPDPALYAFGSISTVWAQLPERVRAALHRCREPAASTVVPVPVDGGGDRAFGVATAVGGGVDGAIWLEYARPRPATTTDDTAVAAALTAQLGLALERARSYDQARATSLTLQRAMLGASAELPPRFAVRYEPAVLPLEIGGDWYDVMSLPDNKIGVIVGDCVGSGLAAAAVMGQLRSSARALLSTGVGPGRMLDQLDVASVGIPGARCSTVFAAVLDPERGMLCYSSAGHVPALLAVPDTDARWLDDEAARSLPLATFDCAPRPQVCLELPRAATLVLFTDGLVERRDQPIDLGLDAVANLLTDAHQRTPDELADLVVTARRPRTGYDDDVAMVIYRRPPAPLSLDIAAEPEKLGTLRRKLQSWLVAAGADGLIAGDIVMAANEAATNSIEHGYRGLPAGRVVLTAADKAGVLTVTITDQGRWVDDTQPMAPPLDGHRGRGIDMMRSLVDSLTVEHSWAGTVVQLRTDLARRR